MIHGGPSITDIEKYSLSESTKVSLYCDSSVRLVIFWNTFSTFSRSVSLEVFFSFSVTVFVTVDVTVFVTVSVTAKIFRFTSVFVSSDEFIWAVHTCTLVLISPIHKYVLIVLIFSALPVPRPSRFSGLFFSGYILSSGFVIIIFTLSVAITLSLTHSAYIWMLKREWRVNHWKIWAKHGG